MYHDREIKAASRESNFRQEAVGEFPSSFQIKKYKQYGNVENKLKRSIKTYLLSKVV